MGTLPNTSRALLVIAAVLVAGSLLIFLQHTAGILRSKRIAIPPEAVLDAGGLAFSIGGGQFTSQLVQVHPMAMVVEDGIAMRARVHVTEDVKVQGHGRYTFSPRRVWFSSSDGSDPRSNGRNYAVIFPSSIAVPVIVSAWIALFAGLVFAVRARYGVWIWSWWRRQTSLPFSETPRDWSLDVLRAIAVLLVLARHAIVFPKSVSHFMHSTTLAAQRGGWIGVDLFFVLSGYLVSGLLFKEYKRTSRLRVGRFLCRRALKIYPAFWVMLLVTLIGASFGLVPTIGISSFIGELLFLQNYIGGIWMHTWSLAVEEHFYLLLAFMFALAVENGRDQSRAFFPFVPRVFATIAIVCLVLRCLRHLYIGSSASMDFAQTHLRLDGLMCGVWLRHWQESHAGQFRRISQRGASRWMALALLLVAPFFFFDQFEWQWVTTVGYTVLYFAAASLLVSSRSWDARWPWLKRWAVPFAMIGRHSYSIYLWHLIVRQWLARPLFDSFAATPDSAIAWLAFTAIYYGGSIACGIFMGKMIEQPVLHLRDRWFPSRVVAII